MIIEMYIYFYGIYGHDHRDVYICISMVYGHDHRDVYLFLWYIWS